MTLYRKQWSRPFPRERDAKRQNGCLRRPYRELRKEEKLEAKEKRKDIPTCDPMGYSKPAFPVSQSCPILCDAMDCSTPGSSIHVDSPSGNTGMCCRLLPQGTQTHLHWVTGAIQLSHPLSSPFPPALPSIFPSIRVFSNELALCIRWTKYGSFSFRISPSNEYSALISFRIDWFDLLAVQRTLKSLLHTTVLKPPFFGSQSSLWPDSHNCTWLLEKP